MRSIDTNVLVRLVVRDDAGQVAAAETFIGNGAWVSHLVLAETVWVLDSVYERSSRQIAAAVEMLLNHRQLSLQDAGVVTAALGRFRSRPTGGFSDCLMLEIAAKAGYLPLGTFDKGLAKQAGTERL